MTKSIRIANGQGFWGDSVDAPKNLIKYGKFNYLTLDYLAEVTLSIMQRQKMNNPNLGYAVDFIELIDSMFDDIIKKNIKIITNAGGVNPKECAKQIIKLSKNKKNKFKVAIIEGDDILLEINN